MLELIDTGMNFLTNTTVGHALRPKTDKRDYMKPKIFVTSRAQHKGKYLLTINLREEWNLSYTKDN